jgi:hypothetical protein
MRDWCVALTQRAGVGRGLVAGGSWPDGQPSPPSSQSAVRKAVVDRSEATMSKLARALILGATLAAMNLAGMTAVAHAYPLDPAADHAVAAQQHNPTDAQEQFRRGERASQEQTAADAAGQRLLARERSSIPSGTPAPVPAPVQPGEPGGQPDWLVPAIGGLAAVVTLVAGLVVLATRRTGRRVQPGQAA